MSVSVITTVDGDPAQLGPFLRRVGRAMPPPDELLVVVPSGTPGVAVRKIAGVETRVVEVAPSGSAVCFRAAARNVAASRARHDVLVFLDVDTAPSRRLIYRLATAVAETDAVVVCIPRQDPLAGLETLDLPAVSAADLFASAAAGLDQTLPANGRAPLVSSEQFATVACGMPRRVIEDVGGFDEFYVGAEICDRDLHASCRARGHEVWLIGARCHQLRPPPPDLATRVPDLLSDARYYWTKWGEYPMQEALADLARRGLIDFDGRSLDTRPRKRPRAQSGSVAAASGPVPRDTEAE